jgi:hypothetical protein
LLGATEIGLVGARHLTREGHIGKVLNNYFAPSGKKEYIACCTDFFYGILILIHGICRSIK